MRELLPRRTREEELRGEANVSEGAARYATDETWLWRNRKALASVLEGLAQAVRRDFAEPPNEKGEQMAAIDDATAKRIAKHLRHTGVASDLRVGAGYDRLADAIQEAAEPQARATGLYFVKQCGSDVHLEELWADMNGGVTESWVTWGGVAHTQPDGDIISGPHTCEELLEAVQK